MPGIYNPMKQGALDIKTELRYPRYFVILQAYDFQLWNKTKQKRLLWTSRFSIKAQRHPFDENLKEMEVASSRFFGTDSQYLRQRQESYRVEFGEIEMIGI